MTAIEITVRLLLFATGLLIGYGGAMSLSGIALKESARFRAFVYELMARYASPIEKAEWGIGPTSELFCAVCGAPQWRHSETGFNGISPISSHKFADPTEPR